MCVLYVAPYISRVLPERLLRKLSQVRTMLLKVQVLRTCHSQNRCPYDSHYQYLLFDQSLPERASAATLRVPQDVIENA